MNEIELIYDHYKDSFSIIKEKEKKRDKLFIILFVLLLILFLCSMVPDKIYLFANAIIKSKIDMEFILGFEVLQTFLWIIIFYTTVKYFQVTIHIERGYVYLHDVENQIDEKIIFKFQREGKQYLDNYPLLLDSIYHMYITVFPILYFVLVIFKIMFEWKQFSNIFMILIDTIICAFVLTIIFLYYKVLHNDMNKNK